MIPIINEEEAKKYPSDKCIAMLKGLGFKILLDAWQKGWIDLVPFLGMMSELQLTLDKKPELDNVKNRNI